MMLSGHLICCSGYSRGLKGEIHEKVKEMGGEYTSALRETVTHLVTESTQSEKYRAAIKYNIAGVSMEWINEAYRCFLSRTQVDIVQLTERFRLPPMTGLTICTTGFDLRIRDDIQEQVVANGGTFVLDLSRNEATHLIAYKGCGEKYQAANKWGLPIVNLQWLQDSLKLGVCLDHESYSVSEETDRRRIAELRSKTLENKRQHFPHVPEETPTEMPPSNTSGKIASISDEYDPQPHVDIRDDVATHRTNDMCSDSRLGSVENVTPSEEVTGESTLFRGLDFVAVGYTAEQQNIIKQEIERNSGCFYNTVPLPTDIGFRILYSISPLFYDEEFPHDSRLSNHHIVNSVSECWVERCLQDNVVHNLDSCILFRPLKSGKVPGFERCRISISGYEGVLRAHLEKLVTSLGAKFTYKFSKKNTHLLCPTPEGTKFEKSTEWRIPKVSAEWIFEIAKTRQIVDYTRFRISGIGDSDVQKDDFRKHDHQTLVYSTSSSHQSYSAEHDTKLRDKPFSPSPSSSFSSSLKEFKPNFNIEDALEQLQPGSTSSSKQNGSKFTGSPIHSAITRNLSIALSRADVQSPRPVSDSMSGQLGEDSRPESPVRLLDGVRICLSQKLVHQKSELSSLTRQLGGEFLLSWSDSCTHLLHQGTRASESSKLLKRAKAKNKFIVSPWWLHHCLTQKQRLPEADYPFTYNPSKLLSLSSKPPAVEDEFEFRTFDSQNSRMGAKSECSLSSMSNVSAIASSKKHEREVSFLCMDDFIGKTDTSNFASEVEPNLLAEDHSVPFSHTFATEEEILEGLPHIDSWESGLNLIASTKSSKVNTPPKANFNEALGQFLSKVEDVKQEKRKSRNSLITRKTSLPYQPPDDAKFPKFGGTQEPQPEPDRNATPRVIYDDPESNSHKRRLVESYHQSKKLKLSPERQHCDRSPPKNDKCSDLSVHNPVVKDDEHSVSNTKEITVQARLPQSKAIEQEQPNPKSSPLSPLSNTADDKGTDQAVAVQPSLNSKKVLPPTENSTDATVVLQPSKSKSVSSNLPPTVTLSKDVQTAEVELATVISGRNGRREARRYKETHKFLLSAMPMESKTECEEIIKKLNGTILHSDYWHPQCTHLVMGKPLRSEKYLAAVAKGAWIMRPAYLDISMKSGKFVGEEDFVWGKESKGINADQAKLIMAAKHWRSFMETTKRSVFSSWNVLLVVGPQKRDSYIRLLEAGGAVVTSKTVLNLRAITSQNYTHIFVDKPPRNKDVLERLEGKGILLDPTYLGDYLTTEPFGQVNPENYLATNMATKKGKDRKK
ncbi:hypothetical protein BKA69DRAFT_761693 [Paraphysoderma sedebokerense]|nr:hypothetical protein BKA69DRAFT_761693 [Paraphysoderma sedebokerense]